MVAAGTAADGSTAVVPDVAARMPGRGAWVHPDTACLDLALRRRALPRALRVVGPIGPASLQQLAQHLGATSTTGSASTTTTAPPTDESTESEAGQHQMGTR